MPYCIIWAALSLPQFWGGGSKFCAAYATDKNAVFGALVCFLFPQAREDIHDGSSPLFATLIYPIIIFFLLLFLFGRLFKKENAEEQEQYGDVSQADVPSGSFRKEGIPREGVVRKRRIEGPPRGSQLGASRAGPVRAS